MDSFTTAHGRSSQLEIGSILSTPSNISNSSNFPSYGLIKVSNYANHEDYDSNDSLSLNSSTKFNEAFNGNGPSNTSEYNLGTRISFHSLSNKSYQSDIKEESPSVELGHGQIPKLDEPTQFSFQVNTVSPNPLKAVELPAGGIERVKVILDRVIQSYHGDRGGVFLTDTIFLTKALYSNQETIQNGSVKINIIQEINELLSRFLTDNQQAMPTLANIQTTLNYYKKLMNAFDILKAESYATSIIDTDSDNSSLNQSPKRIFTGPTTGTNNSIHRLDSIDSKNSIGAESTAQVLSPSVTSIPATHKKHDSLIILGRLKGKLKSAKTKRVSLEHDMASLSDTKSQVQYHTRSALHPSLNTHSTQGNHCRSASVSTINTQNSSRSAKDQASLQEYFQALESLHKTIIRIHTLYADCTSVEIVGELNEIIGFASDYIIHFLLNDVFKLIYKHMTRLLQEMV